MSEEKDNNIRQTMKRVKKFTACTVPYALTALCAAGITAMYFQTHSFTFQQMDTVLKNPKLVEALQELASAHS